MNLIPYDEKAIPTVLNVRTDNFKLLTEFAQSGLACAKVDGYPHKTATCCATALRASIKRYRMLSISVTVRDKDVYLIKKPIEKKQ